MRRKILEALQKIRWYELVPEEIYLIDSTLGFAHREHSRRPPEIDRRRDNVRTGGIKVIGGFYDSIGAEVVSVSIPSYLSGIMSDDRITSCDASPIAIGSHPPYPSHSAFCAGIK